MGVTIQDIRVICTAPEGINLVVIKVETNQPGLYGLGCGTFAYRHLLVKQVVEEYLKPLLVGRNAENIEELWQLMHQNAYWRNGPVENNAISGVDMALWDIKGKLAGMPCYQLFGGKCREGIPVYRHVDGKDLSEICENIQRYQEMGITHLRCQCGGYEMCIRDRGQRGGPAGGHQDRQGLPPSLRGPDPGADRRRVRGLIPLSSTIYPRRRRTGFMPALRCVFREYI